MIKKLNFAHSEIEEFVLHKYYHKYLVVLKLLPIEFIKETIRLGGSYKNSSFYKFNLDSTVIFNKIVFNKLSLIDKKELILCKKYKEIITLRDYLEKITLFGLNLNYEKV